ncbi:MAG: hypothetical protein JAZ02_20355 [Candidatus Thiodiazotropha endolucinida]|nr:hypothetical protein [Candidatus Thiodiazotropha endolucinida]
MRKYNNKWSIVVTNTHYIKTPDRDDICGSNSALADAYDHLHHQWIGADEFFRRFTHLFGDFIYHGERPAVTSVFQQGLSAYADVLQRDNRRYFPHDRLKAFLSACFFQALIVCRFSVIDSEDGETWSLLLNHDVPLSLWKGDRKKLDVEEIDIDQEHFSELLYEKSVPENMKRAMRRFSHEAAIMAGHLDSRH